MNRRSFLSSSAKAAAALPLAGLAVAHAAQSAPARAVPWHHLWVEGEECRPIGYICKWDDRHEVANAILGTGGKPPSTHPYDLNRFARSAAIQGTGPLNAEGRSAWEGEPVASYSHAIIRVEWAVPRFEG